MLKLDLYCKYTLAHAVKAVVSVRRMLEITKSLTLLVCQTGYTFKQKHNENYVGYVLGRKQLM